MPARIAATSVYDEVQATEALLVFFVPHAEHVPESDVASLHEFGELSVALSALTSAINKHVISSLGLAPRSVVPVTDGAFHRTTSGKIQRGAFKKEYADGHHEMAVRSLEHAAHNTTAASYHVVWRVARQDDDERGLASREMGAAEEVTHHGREENGFECTEEPLYLLAPVASGAHGAAFVQAVPAKAFRTLLPSMLEKHHAAIAQADLLDWSDFVDRPYLVCLVLDDDRLRISAQRHLHSLHATACLLQALVGAGSSSSSSSSSATDIAPRLLLITTGALATSAQQDALPASAHAGVWGLAGAARIDAPHLGILESDILNPPKRAGGAAAGVVQARKVYRAGLRGVGGSSMVGKREEQAAWRKGRPHLPRLVTHTLSPPNASSSSNGSSRGGGGSNDGGNHGSSVLITGGLGGLGLNVAAHLLKRTSYTLILTSRSGVVSRETTAAYALLPLQAPSRLSTAAIDCSKVEEVLALFRSQQPGLGQ